MTFYVTFALSDVNRKFLTLVRFPVEASVVPDGLTPDVVAVYEAVATLNQVLKTAIQASLVRVEKTTETERVTSKSLFPLKDLVV